MWTAFEPRRRRTRILAFGVLLMWFRQATASDVTLDVHVALVDNNGAPIANAPMRLVFGNAPGWDAPGAGIAFTTDAKGEHHFTTTTSLDTQRLKVPTNFFTQLVSLPEKTRHLRLAAELPYRGEPRLYVADVNRFPDGANLGRAVMQAYGADAQGRFTVPAGTAGHKLSQFFLKPSETDAADATRWSVKLTFLREPEPVQR
jgi:hypothetical protein